MPCPKGHDLTKDYKGKNHSIVISGSSSASFCLYRSSSRLIPWWPGTEEAVLLWDREVSASKALAPGDTGTTHDRGLCCLLKFSQGPGLSYHSQAHANKPCAKMKRNKKLERQEPTSLIGACLMYLRRAMGRPGCPRPGPWRCLLEMPCPGTTAEAGQLPGNPRPPVPSFLWSEGNSSPGL